MNGIQKFEMWLDEMDNQLEKANKAGVPLMVEEIKEEKKYPNGYMPKIEYWLDKVENGRTKEGRAHAKSKVLYFLKKEMERA
jgi:hypothetical protein